MPLGMTSLFLCIDGNRTRSDNKQSGGLFVRRGNERKRGDRHGSAETNSHHPLQKRMGNFKYTPISDEKAIEKAKAVISNGNAE